MISLTKKSFLTVFILVFSISLIVLGGVQTLFGTMRLYNVSEQLYEERAPKTQFTNSESLPISSTKKTQAEKNEDVFYYVTQNKEEIEKALQNMPVEKAKDVTKKIQTIQKNGNKKTEKENTNTEKTQQKFVSPVIVRTEPKDAKIPLGYRETIGYVVAGGYFRDALWNFPIIIDTERVEPRGQMYNESITLSGSIISLNEVSKVLVHEIGHMIDIYTLKKRLQKPDPSQSFYNISWVKPDIMKAGISTTSFVSGYAATSQYEDFAESFTLYIFHNNEFLRRAQNNEILQQKYDFLKSKIFGEFFLGTSYEKIAIPKKIWDVTKVAIKTDNLQSIFAWLQHYMS